jgi:transcriptional regulator with XRE-family HTH domain
MAIFTFGHSGPGSAEVGRRRWRMSVSRNNFVIFSGNASSALAAPVNLICLSDSDRVCDEPDDVAPRHGPGRNVATSPIGPETGAFFVSVRASREAVAELPPRGDTWTGLEVDQTLGQLMSEARKRRGLSREQVANETHIPAYYVRMIESDSYDAIPDQLYLLPFFERYAIFLGLDARKVVSQFLSDFEKSENEIVIPTAGTSTAAKVLSDATVLLKSRWRQIAAGTAAAVVAVPVIVWSFGTIRTIGRHSADTTLAVTVSPKISPATNTGSSAAGPDAARAPESKAVPPSIAVASATPQIAEQSRSPIRQQRRRGRSRRLSHRFRRSRRGIT